jgi:hypothetical protein
MAECDYNLLVGVQSSCLAVKRVGGLDKRIYISTVSSLASVTFGTGNSITAFVFKSGRGFVKYIGKPDKNSSGTDIEPGENVNIRNHTISPVVYYETKEDLEALDNLIDAEGIFAVVETRAGGLEVFGINKVNFDAYGMKVTANPQNSGVVINDNTAFLPVISGGHTNLQLLYNPSVVLATNVIALDAQTIDGNS